MKTPKTRKVQRSDFAKFDEAVYSKTPLSGLIVYAVHDLLGQQIEIALDDVVFACFLLFPRRFALKKYASLPDSALVSRRWQDCRSKGYIAANTDAGFKLTAKGERLAIRVAKTLGIDLPKPKRKPQKKKVTPPVKVEQKRIQPPAVTQAKKAKVARKKKATPPSQVEQKPIHLPAVTQVKKAKVTRKKNVTPPVRVEQKQIQSPAVTQAKKAKVTRKKNVTPPVRVEQKQIQPPVVTQVKKVEVERKKKITPPVKVEQKQIQSPVVTKVKKVKVARKKKATPPSQVEQKPIHLPAVTQVKKVKVERKKKITPPVMVEQKQIQPPVIAVKKVEIVRKKKPTRPAKPIWTEKATPLEPNVQPVKAQPAQVEKAISPVTPEAKSRAGKFVRMMETSDAYVVYRKHGKNSNISEFDFRSLLLCTMESSAETLARNVEQFKGYAGIHKRNDLILFLDFCANKFIHLLTPQKKMARIPIPRGKR